MGEKTLKAQIIRMIKKEFPKAWVWKVSDKFYSGIPDLLVLINGYALFLEIKFGDNNLTKLQEYTIKQIRKAGIAAYEVRSVEEARSKILLEGGKK